MREYLLRVVIVFCSLSLNAIAEEQNEATPMNMVSQALVIEALIAVNSGIASYHPEGFGWSMTVISPLCAANDGAGWQQLSGFAVCLGVGQYNVQELSKDKYSSGDIFEKNFVLMNGLLATAAIGDKLLEYFEAPEEFSFKPTNDAGLALTINKVF